ncbi:MAG: hypothetical protein JNM72_24955 [Deltaproteobacteria bacterium]|nr:hypothetical protein [Deltaproteobacteria bacterium]
MSGPPPTGGPAFAGRLIGAALQGLALGLLLALALAQLAAVQQGARVFQYQGW